MSVTIYHNPRCSTSRRTLALLQDKGVAPKIVEYLKTPLDEAALRALLKKLKLGARDIMRSKEAVYKELGLGDEGKSEDELIAAIAAHPVLLERPIVVNGARAALGRPPENVLALL